MVFAEGHKVRHIYLMCAQIHPAIHTNFAAVAKPKSWDEWHHILSHVNTGAIKLMKTGNLVLGMDVDTSTPVSQCVACIQGKHHVNPFPKHAEDAAEPVGDLTVSDIWGPANTVGPGQECYFYSFTDAKSHYSTVYFSHTKDSVLDHFKDHTALVETQTGNCLKQL